jgi:formamidase
MPEVIYAVDRDLSVPMAEQVMPGHNRWHPDIPPVVAVDPGGPYRIECKEWTDEQIGDTDSPDDVAAVNLDKCHMLSGPIAINGAQPGDILVVDLLDMGPFPGHEWGYTGVFAKGNGGGFLCDPTFRAPRRRSGIWRGSTAPRATFPACASPGCRIRACSAARRRTSCWPNGTAGSRTWSRATRRA